jgi:hypothetical protein
MGAGSRAGSSPPLRRSGFAGINLTPAPGHLTICTPMRHLLTIGTLLLCSSAGFGCGSAPQGNEAERPWVTARFALTGGECVEHENQDTQFPSNADRVVTRVSGFSDPELGSVVESISAGSQNAAGEITIEKLPEGDDLVLEMSACLGTQTTWTGQSRGLAVEIGQETYVDVFLTPVDEVACLGQPGDANQLPNPHMFATSSPVDERSVWLIGGFASYDDDASERRLDAGSWVSVYDVPTASVTAYARLAAARAMAAASRMPDGRTIVAGGTKSIRLLSPGQPPLWPGLSGPPSPSIEILSPGSDSTVAGPEVELSELPACVGVEGGKIVCVGGLQPSGELSKKAWVIDHKDVTTFQFPDGRYGATVVAAQDGSGALVWGGHIGAPTPNAAMWVSLGEQPSAQPLVLNPPLEPYEAVPLFASGAALPAIGDAGPRFLVLGGSDAADGTLPHSLSAQTARATLIVVNALSGTAKRYPIELGDVGANPELRNNLRRFAGQVVPLGQERFWLVGGVTAFAWDVACEVDNPCFQRDSIVFRLDHEPVANPDLAQILEERTFDLNAGPFGMTALPLYDDSWLVLGGMQSVTEAPFLSTDAALVRHNTEADDLCSIEQELIE